MKAGCPFIALNGSAITEVAGNAGFLMNNLSLIEFKIGVDLIKTNREKLILLGLIQASLFSWDKCFAEILEIYKEIDKENNI
jgi:mannosyltransferase